MKTLLKSKTAYIFIIIAWIVLLSNSVVVLLFTGSLHALLAIIFHAAIAYLMYSKSKYFSLGIMVWGVLIIMTGIFKIVLQTLASFQDLLSNPIHLLKLAIILIGYTIWRIGVLEMQAEDQNH